MAMLIAIMTVSARFVIGLLWLKFAATSLTSVMGSVAITTNVLMNASMLPIMPSINCMVVSSLQSYSLYRYLVAPKLLFSPLTTKFSTFSFAAPISFLNFATATIN